ncbi:MAG: FG-GAP-like repeat-containing protein, partial [Bacteroidota bacterium]
QEVVALINNGGNSFTTTPLVINAEKGQGLKVADLDNDGDMDFVVGRNQQVRVRMWLQTPTGLVGSPLSDVGTPANTPQVIGLDVADTNSDGKNEVVFADFARDELVLISFNCFSGAALTTSTVNASCGQPNGSITVTATGGTDLSYLWSNGATTATAANLAPGNYTITVTANGGCTSTATATITASQVATVSTTKANATCGNTNGTATVNSQNGVGLAGFLWSSGATTQTATGLAAGTYTVTVTDVNGCTVTSSATISATPVATLTLTPTNTTCGNNDGKVTVSVAGGSPITSYSWSNGATTQNLLNVPGGSYSVTATDGNGCQIIGSATVTALTNPTVNLGADITFQQGQQAVLDATGTGLTYLWSTGATTPTITVTSMGTYSVTVTNSSGCTATDAVVVTVTTSTNDQDNKYKITVSPNPSHDIIYIRCEGSSTSSVELIDNLGWLLLKDNSFAPDGSIRTMKVDEIPAGTYHLKVSGKGFSKTVSIIKY